MTDTERHRERQTDRQRHRETEIERETQADLKSYAKSTFTQ